MRGTARLPWRLAAIVLQLASLAPLAPAQPPPAGGVRLRAPVPIAADSARADSAAFAALPERLREVLDVRRQLQPWDAAPGLTCVPLSATSDGSRRQRVQGRLSDSRALVVFARATRAGAIARVEFVRRLPNGGQAGYTWDAQGDETTALEWPPELTAPSSYPIPRGSPVPRALRGLGRLVLAWPCADR